jgi:polyhydroxyalkanoate synthesis repressor PhaR
VRTIKRYPNRLLYDPQVSAFVTGETLRDYVRRGVEFAVVESRTGEDVTLSVLSNVLIDDLHRSGNRRSVIDTIRGFIALKGELKMDILKKTVLASVGMFEITKAKAEEIVDTLIKQGEIAKSKRSEAVLELIEKAEDSGKTFKDKVAKDVERTIQNLKVAKKNDLAKLEKKVDDLAAQVKALVEKMGGTDFEPTE